MRRDRRVMTMRLTIGLALSAALFTACGGGRAARTQSHAGRATGATGAAAAAAPGRSFVPDFIGPYAANGSLTDGGSVRLLSNGNVRLRWGRSAPLLRVRPWGRIEVSCTRPAPRAAFTLSAAAKGESAVVQTVARRAGRPVALVPIAHQGSPIVLPHSGPPQRLSTIELSVATEAMSVAGTLLVSVQWNRTGCESATTAVVITHRS